MKPHLAPCMLILLILALAGGCAKDATLSPGDEAGDASVTCARDADCPPGKTCVEGLCTPEPADGDGEEGAAPDGDEDAFEIVDKEAPGETPAEEQAEEDAAPGEADTETAAEIDAAEAEQELGPFHAPDAWGPYTPGELDYPWRDSTRGGLLGKDVATKVWYPAQAPPPDKDKVRYLGLIEGLAYPNIALDRSGGPYPLVLFSHGNKGINFQSFTFTSHLASHGFIIAAPNHSGNMMYDNPSDEQMAQIALDRPIDIAFVRAKMEELNNDPTSFFYQMVDLTRVAVAGHSFGGYTTLVLAGATMNVDDARARCLAGTEADIFCPYIDYWTAGSTVSRPANMQDVKAAVAMAPGGYAAFGDDGLANLSVPLLLMGGTLDEFLRPELRPLYAAAPPPKIKVEITGMGHMGFTDICRIPGVELIPTLGEMCDPDVLLDIERGWEIINPFAIAFLVRYLYHDPRMEAYLSATYAAGFPEVGFESQRE